MEAKPELSASANVQPTSNNNVQNVVVYVSNDHFGQAYATPSHPSHQNQHQHHHHHHHHQQQQHAPMGHNVAPTLAPKLYAADKYLQNPAAAPVASYYTNPAVIAHPNGYAHSQPATHRKDEYHDVPAGYVVIGGGGRSCDSVRSDAAESSCSSLSSTEDIGGGGGGGVLIMPPSGGGAPGAMLVYDASGNCVASANPSLHRGHPQQQQHGVVLTATRPPPCPSIAVPHGWKRVITDGVVIYISPSSTALTSLEHVKDYLQTPGTCKCGLECPLKYDAVFNFDPKIVGRAWTFTPDTNNGDLTKLCNHKRKYMQHLKDCNQLVVKRRKRTTPPTIGLPPLPPGDKHNRNMAPTLEGAHLAATAAGASIPHLQMMPQQFITKDTNMYSHQQPSQPLQPTPMSQSVVAPPQLPPNAGYQLAQMPPQQQQQHPQQQFIQSVGFQGNPQLIPSAGAQPLAGVGSHVDVEKTPIIINEQMQVISSGGPLGPSHAIPSPLQFSMAGQPQPPQRQMLIPAGNLIAPNGQRMYINNQEQLQPEESNANAPGRPMQMISVRPEKAPLQPWMEQHIPQTQPLRQFTPNGYRQQGGGKMWIRPTLDATPLDPGPIPQKNIFERIPPLPLPGHVQVQVWPSATNGDEIVRKKVKMKKKRYIEGPPTNHLLVDQPSASPSFLEDPSAFLAQQTALLNSTIQRQGEPDATFISDSLKPSRTPSDSLGIKSTLDVVNYPNCVVSYQAPSPQSEEKFGPDTPETVTSSNYSDKASPDSRPIQGGTVSTSNVSPAMELDESGTSHIELKPDEGYYTTVSEPPQYLSRGLVTTMASGRTVGSNTITSVLAGRANTATVSITPSQNATRSPLEMVQSVVSSIKIPPGHNHLHNPPQPHNHPLPSPQVVPKGLPPGHILVSSGGQLIMAQTSSPQGHMPPPPPKSMPPISVSPMVTNVTASMTQMLPAVAQQVLGQQTVLVNTMPTPFVLQPGVTMTMDGMNQLQIPQLVAGNVIQQQLAPGLLSPEAKTKKSKKRKVPTPTVASMLQIAAQQNANMVGFPQQIQMHSPPVMQALTIVPGKAGGQAQLVMNQQTVPNLLQPVNLTQGMVQNVMPAIQQFVLPTNLGSMVMNPDGSATIVQDTTNLGMQLQLQNVNGQNVLTPLQNNQMFNSQMIQGGMVIRPQGKILQQQHSPGAQFLSPTGGGQFMTQFNGQLSPLVASVSPGQQVTFSPQIRPTAGGMPHPQENQFIQCGQTLMVPANVSVSQGALLQSGSAGAQSTSVQVQLIPNHKQTHLPGLKYNYRNSVSTQTAVNHTPSVATFCQTSTTSAGSPPDTTTLSPMTPGGQSPPSADTTTHTGGSTDDGLSPAPSNCSDGMNNLNALRQSSMAMVHCVSSSEPDSGELTSEYETLWQRGLKHDFGDGMLMKKSTPTRVAFAESSTMVQYVTEGGCPPGMHIGMMKHPPESVMSTRHLEKSKRKHSDALIAMDSRIYTDDRDDPARSKLAKRTFRVGDLVWGPWNACPAWPGTVMQVSSSACAISVRWFGGGGNTGTTDTPTEMLQTLSEGLEVHHRAGSKLRTGRKLNAQLEKAIQEAMAELDRHATEVDDGGDRTEVAYMSDGDGCRADTLAGRLRSSRQAQ